ncbi:alpha/beta fold hydrolase [Streptosporangium sp. NPDC049644]|uniref:alpha/beta fold hydrolase n=1 Tax=Streptosporangium sp. NPDC049644 TaxID=3155507 RepID=UPI00343A0C32
MTALRRGPAGIDVRIRGDGSPVLLLHGIGGSSESFAAQLTGLASAHRVIAWDAPGYRGSPNLPEPVALADYADAAFEVLDGLGARPAHVLGVSWGGVIATSLALRRPEAVRSLVLADSSRGSGRTEASRTAMAQRVASLAELGPRAFARLRGPALVAPGADPAVTEQVVAGMSRLRHEGYAAAATSMASTDHGADLRRIAVPTLVVVGEHDTITGVAESEELARGIPGSGLTTIADAGHAANQERPEEFNAAVLRFLAEVDATTQTGTCQ